ncbi:RtcB family protein [bacterium]|nr:MAG: RtcB family protein [bacterium]
MDIGELEKLDNYRWRIPKSGAMLVDGVIYASQKLIGKIIEEKAVEQVKNVACLPGIVKSSMAMPDAHWGYGFCIGGVAGMDVEEGVVSPGGVGYDINCGVRLLGTSLDKSDVAGQVPKLAAHLFNAVPAGIGSHGTLKLSYSNLKKVLLGGSEWAVREGFGWKEDLVHTEEGGKLPASDTAILSERALERGKGQVGTLGSGNHFLEVQWVERVFDEKTAGVFGLREGQIVIMLHSGSRGFGYQVCDDFLKVMARSVVKNKIFLPDRQLACSPVKSEEGQRYLEAMNQAANYAWANRQVMAHVTREVFSDFFGESPENLRMNLIYDVCHNIAKFETHNVEGKKRKLLVHRKGATRAFGPGAPGLPDIYNKTGQPVLIPGDMGRASWVLAGTKEAMDETFGSSCHGAGRALSRSAAKKLKSGAEVSRELHERGIEVFSTEMGTLAEEMSEAYKDVDDVVEAVCGAKIGRKVARLRPLAVVKG